MSKSSSTTNGASPHDVDVAIVGAGFGGMYLLHRARELGLSARIIEAGSGVGGTWYWNRYPGARCDVESMEYSYQFSHELEQEWHWTERYAAQPEILTYANHVADRFDLRRDIQFDTRVTAARFNEDAGSWSVFTDDGATLTAAHCVLATGCLSSTNTPDFKGLESFAGATYHTGQWPHEGVDFTGLKVGIIGTGSSAIQSIPLIAEQAAHLTVFQRTPNFAVPAHNGPLDPEYERYFKANYAKMRAIEKTTRNGTLYIVNEQSALDATAEERESIYQEKWEVGGLGFMASFNDLLVDKQANETAGEFIAGKIRNIVDDPTVAKLLTPKSVVGCKRLCVDTDYYKTYNRPNVSLVDVSETAIEEITPGGLTTGGREFEFDAIVFATGFDAMTGSINKIKIRGRNDALLSDKWAAGPRAYLGIATAGFPNLFMVTGPGSPSVLTNMMTSIEHHVEWISDCIAYARAQGATTVEATSEAEESWVGRVNELAGRTLYPTCNSWYLGANVPGKPRVFMPYLGNPDYLAKTADVAAKGYEGFALT